MLTALQDCKGKSMEYHELEAINGPLLRLVATHGPAAVRRRVDGIIATAAKESEPAGGWGDLDALDGSRAAITRDELRRRLDIARQVNELLRKRVTDLEDQFVGLIEGVGELAWGIGLPKPFLLQPPLDFNADLSELVPKPLAVAPETVQPFFEAIYQRWKKSDLHHLLRDARKQLQVAEGEIRAAVKKCEQIGPDADSVLEILQRYQDRTP